MPAKLVVNPTVGANPDGSYTFGPPVAPRSEKIRAVAKAMEDQVINVAFVEKGNGYSPLPAAQWVRSVLERVGYQEIQWWLDNSLAHPDWDHCVYAGVDIKGNWFLALKNWEG